MPGTEQFRPLRPGYFGGVTRPLHIGACRSACHWLERDETRSGEPLFGCTGCGSEWVPSEPWTPVDWTGSVPESVQRARDLRGRG